MTTSLQEIVQALAPGAMVQVVIITCGGIKYAMIGPIMDGADITEIEFGELVPTDMAIKMLSGERRQWMGEQVQ